MALTLNRFNHVPRPMKTALPSSPVCRAALLAAVHLGSAVPLSAATGNWTNNTTSGLT